MTAALASPARRRLLGRLGTFALAGAGMLLLRDKVIAPRPEVRFPEGVRTTGWRTLVPGPLAILPGTVNGRPVRALIDTGAQLSAIDRALVRALGLSALPFPMVVLGLEGRPQLGRAAILDLTVGAMTARGLRAAELELGGLGLPAGASFSLIIGQNLLQELAVELDMPGRRAALSRAEDFVPPPGAILAATRRDGGRLMASVRVGGAAVEVVVDTGATAPLALAADVAQKAGLLSDAAARPSASITLGGQSMGTEVVLGDFAFSGLHTPRVPVQIYDRAAGGLLGRALLPEGLLGLGALSDRRVALLLGRGQLWLYPPEGRPAKGRSATDAQGPSR